MQLIQELRAYQIDPDRFIGFQMDFIRFSREKLISEKDRMTYREYLEKDQFLTNLERLVIRMERDRLIEKISEFKEATF